MNKEKEIMNKDIKGKHYKLMGGTDTFSYFKEIVFENAKLPKNPLNCKNCDKQHKTGVLRPNCFCIKDTRYLSVSEVFVQLRCSTCGNITYMKYNEYLELIFPRIKKENKKAKEERNLQIIEQVYKVGREEALKIQKENEEQNKKMLHRLEQKRQVRMIDYEDENRKKKSEEKKQLIKSGELLYDKKNRVFYYKSTGKVYS